MNLDKGSTTPAPDLPGGPLPAEQWESAREAIDTFLAEHPGGSERLIPLLHAVQRRLGYLPFEAQELVAQRLGLSPVQVYEVISFYHFFTTTPRGKYQVKVCMGTACFVRGSQRLIDVLEEVLAVKLGGISDDGLFNLEQVRCIGACGLAPAIMVSDQVHGNLTPAKLRKLVRQLRQQAKTAAPAGGAPPADVSDHAEEEAS